MNIRNIFNTMNISASGLSAQRKRMNIIAENMANAETTRTENGEPYRRKYVQFQTVQQQVFSRGLRTNGTPLIATRRGHFQQADIQARRTDQVEGGVKATQEYDDAAFKLIYEPGHPDADENGYVKMPNVNVVSEMVDMISASRAYEANSAVLNALKNMAKDALEI